MVNITELIPGIWTGGDLPGVTDDAVVDIGA
jgi:hypothetical protein